MRKRCPLQMILLISVNYRIPVYSYQTSRVVVSSWCRTSKCFPHDKFNFHNNGLLSSANPISCCVAMSSTSLETLASAANGSRRRRIGVIGGGASGMFAAAAAAEAGKRQQQQPGENEPVGFDVVVFEGTSKTLSKVRISGGGRCNGELRR